MNPSATMPIRCLFVALGLWVAVPACRPHRLQHPPGVGDQPTPTVMDPFRVPPIPEIGQTPPGGRDPDRPGGPPDAAPSVDVGAGSSVADAAPAGDGPAAPGDAPAIIPPDPDKGSNPVIDAALPTPDAAAAPPGCPTGCQCEITFDDGSADGWELVEYDGDMSEPATTSQLAHSGTRSLMTSLVGSTRFGHFKLLRDVCPGGLFDLRNQRISFWVQYQGLPASPPDTYSGCEVQIALADGTHIQVGERVLWPIGRWHRIESGPGWSDAVKKVGIYCVVGSPSGGGRVYIDDLKIE
jgi:hypothetical protein